jgi:molybdate transport system substrate-binding protein
MSGATARRATAAGLAATALALGACGSEEPPTAPPLVVNGHPTLVVQVSRSLANPLTACTKEYAPADVRVQTGDAAELSTRLKDGEGDLLVADDSDLPQQLDSEDVDEKPEVFAPDLLVRAVPTTGPEVRDFEDLTAGGSTALIGVGSGSTPLGAQTTAALERLSSVEREAVLARVRTQDASGEALTSKIEQGTIDAAIVHATDVLASGGKLRSLPLPPAIDPGVAYSAAVVEDSPRAADAAALLDDLQIGTCADRLRAAGFLAH